MLEIERQRHPSGECWKLSGSVILPANAGN
jgi:hypothetical protein